MRCTGHCCKSFCIGDGSETYERMKAAPTMFKDGAYMVDMLIPLGTDKDGNPQFTCKHFDGENCTDYENRPEMCRQHPTYGRSQACTYTDCTFVEEPE